MTYVKLTVEGWRLGNWMFAYASAVSQFPTDDVTFVLVGQIKADDRDPRLRSELWPDVRYETCEGSHCASCGRCIPQDWRYATLKPDVVRKRFICPERIRRRIDERFGSILSHAVSLGVRRGDFLRLPHTHPFVGTAYYRKAIAKFPKGTDFIVNSDDFPWCRRFFTERRFPGMRFHFAEGEEMLVDLFLPTFCRHNIIGNSTFLWWGAFLNVSSEKRVIIPSRWLGLAICGFGRIDQACKDSFFPGCEIVQNPFGVFKIAEALAAWSAYSFVAWMRRHFPRSEFVWQFILRLPTRYHSA